MTIGYRSFGINPVTPSIPTWVWDQYGSLSPNVTAALDDVNGQYYIRGIGQVSESAIVSTSRASTEIGVGSSGFLYSFASNIPALVPGTGRQIMEARTNKCTNYNANPPALVTPTDAATFNAAVTNMTAAAGAGTVLFGVVDDSATSGILGNVTNSRVYKIDNSSGSGTSSVTLGGLTGNTNAHSLSVYARGSGSGSLRLNNVAGTASLTLGATYARTIRENVTPASNSQWQITAAPGAIVYFTLNDLEEGSFATPPIVVAGASAARAADVPSLTGAAATAALAAKAAFISVYAASVVNPSYLLRYNLTAGAAVIAPQSANTVNIVNNSSVGPLATFGSGTFAGTAKVATGMDSAGMSIVVNGGTKQSTADAWPGNTITSINIGNRAAGDRALNGFMQQLAFSDVKGLFDGITG